ncbi:MAG: hypothetical protein M0Z50_00005 [Planctomycetia bacterium]|jgi:hypothetical protein|nr:hypothetical protein [Planctomycetia bacterium]
MADSSFGGVKIIGVIIVALIVIGGGYWLFYSPPPSPILQYPTSRTALLRRYIALVAQGHTSTDHKAFKLLSWPVRRKYNNHPGRVWQTMEDMNEYLTGLFGADWGNHVKIIPPSDTSSHHYVVAVKTEKFHFTIAPQNDLASPTLGGTEHWGIEAIREFPFTGGAQAQHTAAVTSVLGAINPGAAANVAGIAAAYSDADNGPAWEVKQRLLPTVEDPHAAALRQCIYQLWPVRKDPTVIWMLTKISHDPAYAPNIQNDAKAVLSGRVSNAILVGNDVTHIHRPLPK